jgi:hypothetical protein
MDVKVSYLLSADLVSSRRNIVCSIFDEPDKAAILSMPLFVSTQAECRIRHYSSDGSYTGKSAYSLFMKQIIESSQNQSVVIDELFGSRAFLKVSSPYYGAYSAAVFLLTWKTIQ